MAKHKLPEDYELRTFATSVELRSEDDKPPRGFGHFAVFNQRTEIWPGFFEEVAPGAFDDVLKDDVRVLMNHNPDLILARTGSKTARIGVDDVGGTVEWDFPNTTTGNDLRESMQRGDIAEMSFGFTVRENKWTDLEDGKVLRTILKIKRLYDVSPVTFAAYPQTDVALRSHEAWKESHEEPPPPPPPDNTAEIERKAKERARKLSLLKNK